MILFKFPINDFFCTKFNSLCVAKPTKGVSLERVNFAQIKPILFGMIRSFFGVLGRNKSAKFVRILALAMSLLVLTGCGAKNAQVVYKEVLTPIRCDIKMPLKPKNDGTFESHKARMIYYLECENALKYCIGESDDRK
ncbi:MAG: hypothetical protein MR902_07585 [Campylobacter sp.]|nr:hypothetical protein [Campylobacter sp.]